MKDSVMLLLLGSSLSLVPHSLRDYPFVWIAYLAGLVSSFGLEKRRNVSQVDLPSTRSEDLQADPMGSRDARYP